MPEQVTVSAGVPLVAEAGRKSGSPGVGDQQVSGLEEILSSVTTISRTKAALPLLVISNSKVTSSPTAEKEAVGLDLVIDKAGIAPVGTVSESLGEVTVPLVPVDRKDKVKCQI